MNNPSNPKPNKSTWPVTIAGIVLFLTLVAGALSIIWSAATGRLDLHASAWTLKDVVSGKSAVALADELTSTPFPTGLANAERAMTWLVTGSLGSRVRRGCDPWLFLEDELTVHPHANQNMQQRIDTVSKVRELLRSKGVELVVATVPDKSRTQHKELCNVYRPASFANRLQSWEDALKQRGVHIASLNAPFAALTHTSEQPFLQADTHWSQAGAHTAAQTILKTVDQLPVELTPKRRFALKQGPAQSYPGDLIRLAGVDWLPESLQPARDQIIPIQIEPVETPSNDESTVNNDAAADLFGDANLPSAALLGTSYSRTSSFTPLLDMALQTPVPSFAVDGGDFWKSASRYLNSAEFRETPPRLVIWEIPERVLQMPISTEEQSWMHKIITTSAVKPMP